MSTASTTLPITISPEAAAHVAGLGLQVPFETMLEHARQSIPGLRSLQVTLQPPYDLGSGPCVLIEGIRDDPHRAHDRTDLEWASWKSSAFSPEVSQHFVLLTYDGPHDAGERVS